MPADLILQVLLCAGNYWMLLVLAAAATLDHSSWILCVRCLRTAQKTLYCFSGDSKGLHLIAVKTNFHLRFMFMFFSHADYLSLSLCLPVCLCVWLSISPSMCVRECVHLSKTSYSICVCLRIWVNKVLIGICPFTQTTIKLENSTQVSPTKHDLQKLSSTKLYLQIRNGYRHSYQQKCL